MSFTTIISLRGVPSFNSSTGYGNLPERVLLNIFGYFDEDELRLVIVRVCQHWRTVAENPILWKTLKFTGLVTNTSVICNKIWQYSKAQEIILKDVQNPLAILRQICRCNQHLVSLSLRHCYEITEDSLRYLIASCKSLKHLDLKGTPFKSLIFCEEMAYSQSLSSVNFSDNIYLTVSHITSIILNCRNLDGFHLSTFQPINRIYLTDADTYFLLSHTADRLQSLSLDCCNLGNGSFTSIVNCRQLRYLCLNFAYNFEGTDFENMWKTLEKLKVLKVRFGHQISDVNLKNLFENGRVSMSQLEVADFTGCSKISDFGVKAMSHCCNKLTTLILRNCKHIFSIDAVFNECPKIRLLNIAFCKNLQFKLIPNLKNLKTLFLSDDKKLKYFANTLKSKNNNLTLNLCESEYNKGFQKIYSCDLILFIFLQILLV